jgi:hypothetical protein
MPSLSPLLLLLYSPPSLLLYLSSSFSPPPPFLSSVSSPLLPFLLLISIFQHIEGEEGEKESISRRRMKSRDEKRDKERRRG